MERILIVSALTTRDLQKEVDACIARLSSKFRVIVANTAVSNGNGTPSVPPVFVTTIVVANRRKVE